MHQMSSELLLNVFKKLNSLEMVLVMRVCKDWLEIIDDNRSLWRRLVLPKQKNGSRISTLEVFDRKSKSSLKEVEIQIYLKEDEAESLKHLLEKSKATLRTLYLSGLKLKSMEVEVLENLCWTLPGLTSCRIVGRDSRPNVNLIEHGTSREEEKGLKILWVYTPKSLEEAFSKDPHRFDHLVSLRIGSYLYPSRLITILNRCSQTLKHLSVQLREEIGSQAFATVNLNHLEVLELVHQYSKFPPWLKIPSSCTLINLSVTIASALPRIEKLRVQGLLEVQRLAMTCPNLVELRVDPFFVGILPRQSDGGLIAALRQRKDNFESGMEVEGFKMIHLKRLVFPFENLSVSQISQLRDLVEELVDLKSVKRLIEVEV